MAAFKWLVDTGGSEHCRIKIIASTSSASTSAISASDFTIIGFNVDAHGPYQGFIGEPVQFTGSAENGIPPYDYHWDFGDGDTSVLQNPTHIYDDAGNFTVTLTVTDDDGITVRDSTWAFIRGDNNPPGTPIIDGPTSGKPGVEYEYTFNSTDDDNDDLYYLIDWGDGIEEEIGVFPSGTEAHANHTWANKGTYTIKAKAKDPYNAESDWGQLTVTMPRNRVLSNSLFLRFLQQFSNAFPILRYILGL